MPDASRCSSHGNSQWHSFSRANKAASPQRVMEKVGFQYKRNIIHANLLHVLYRLTAQQWQNYRQLNDDA